MNDGRELSFDRVADEYERTRPSYPSAVLDLLPLSADASVLDLGAGTGKLTRVLAGRYRDVLAAGEVVVPEAVGFLGELLRHPDGPADRGER